MAVLAPWNLTMYLLPGHPLPNTAFRPFNDFQWEMNALSPVLLAALFFPAFGRGAPGQSRRSACTRFCPCCSGLRPCSMSATCCLCFPSCACWPPGCGARAWAGRWLSGYALAGLAVCSLAFSLYAGAGLAAQEAPVVFGQQSRDDYITHNFAAYPAMQFINTQLPPGAKVVFYGNPLGFYCDKPYLWGDAQHSTVIPYDQIHSADDLRTQLQRLGVTHILVNRRYFPLDPTAPDARWVSALTAQLGPPVFEAHGAAVYALK